MNIATMETVAIAELGATAREDARACGNHLGSESELLAVKDERVLVVIEIVLRVLAVLAQVFYGGPDLTKIIDKVFHASVSLLVIHSNLLVL